MDGERGPPGTTFEPAPLRVLADLDAVRVVSNPLRRSILECLIPAANLAVDVLYGVIDPRVGYR